MGESDQVTSSGSDSNLIGLSLRLTVFSSDAATVERLVAGRDAALSYPRRGGAVARLCALDVEVDSAADLDSAAERFAEHVIEAFETLPETVLRGDELVLEIAITLFPNESMNAGLFVPRALLSIAVQYGVDVYVNAY